MDKMTEIFRDVFAARCRTLGKDVADVAAELGMSRQGLYKRLSTGAADQLVDVANKVGWTMVDWYRAVDAARAERGL